MPDWVGKSQERLRRGGGIELALEMSVDLSEGKGHSWWTGLHGEAWFHLTEPPMSSRQPDVPKSSNSLLLFQIS